MTNNQLVSKQVLQPRVNHAGTVDETIYYGVLMTYTNPIQNEEQSGKREFTETEAEIWHESGLHISPHCQPGQRFSHLFTFKITGKRALIVIKSALDV